MDFFVSLLAFCDRIKLYVTKDELLKGKLIWESAEALMIKDVVKMGIKLLPHITDTIKHIPYISSYLELELVGEVLGKHKQETFKYWISIESAARDIHGVETTVAQRRQVLVTDQLGKHACMFPLCSEEELRTLKGETVEVEYQVIVLPFEPNQDIVPGDIKMMEEN